MYPGTTAVFSDSIYLHSGFPLTPTGCSNCWQTLMQWKGDGGTTSTSPPVEVTEAGGSYVLHGGYGCPSGPQEFRRPLAPASTGAWTDFTFEIYFAHGHGRRMGERVGERHPGAQPVHPPCGTVYPSPYSTYDSLRLGYYRNPAISETGTVTHDEYEVQSSPTPGPQVVSLSYGPSSVDVTNASASVTVTAHLTDGQNITGAYLDFSNPTANQSEPVYLSLVSGSQQDGTWQGTLTVPRGAAAGIWYYNGSVQDGVNNLVYSDGPGAPQNLPAGAPGPLSVTDGAPTNISLPSISGIAQQGQTLTESQGSWTNHPTSYSYQWQSCDGSGNNCSGIPGAADQSYTLTAGDVGSTIRVRETASNAAGSSDPAVSAATVTVLPAVPSTSGGPSISGSAIEGQTLSESHASWSGSPTSYSYQWQSCDGSGNNCSGIPGAADQSYTLTAGDVGSTIRVRETASNAAGSSDPAVSAATVTVLPAVPSTSGGPSISGSAIEGQTLSESHASWSGSPTSYSYQWQSCDGSGNNCSGIPGAADQSYTLTAGDVGSTIRVRETASNAAGSSDPAVSAATVTVLPAVPSTSGGPSISGSAIEGQTLSESHASWSGSPTSYSYQWQSCDGSGNNCSGIPGAADQSYTLTAGDVGSTIRVRETASNAAGSSDPAVSAATVTVLPAVPSTSGGPSISGSAIEGQTLSESHASWSGSPTSYSYQWQSCDGSGNNCSGIPGAADQSYTLTAGDVGSTIRVRETASNAAGSSDPAVSAATVTVLPAVPSTSGGPSISGSAIEGQTLSESHASWSGSPTSYSYQWQSCDGSGNNCSGIPGAADQSYTLTAGDVGSTIRVRETASNAAGSSDSATSAQTSAVQPQSSDGGGTAGGGGGGTV